MKDAADLEAADCPLLTGSTLAGSPPPAAQRSVRSGLAGREGCWKTRAGALLAAAAVLLAVAAAVELAALPVLCRCRAGSQDAVRYPQFLVVGDWGRQGDYNQSLVAAAMARKAAAQRTDFVISTGDNFYPSGITCPEHPTFSQSFTNVYNQTSLQVPWHAVLGNHDYGEADEPKHPDCGAWDKDCYYSPLHELDVRLTQRDPRWHCERSFKLSLAGGRVDVFFLDTTPLMKEYKDVPWRHNKGGILEQSWQAQLLELEGRLARSEAGWKLVVGHHPIRTNHRDWFEYPEMVKNLEPLLMQHGVQAYFNGHDHNLQHIHKPSTGYHQICSGAGSKIGADFKGTKHSPFQYGANGFVAVLMREESMVAEYLGLDSPDPLFSIDIPRSSGGKRR